MANQHASHPAPSHSSSGSDDGREVRARLSLTGAVSRARHRLGGVLRWDEADGAVSR